MQTNQFTLHKEIIAVCSQFHTKHIQRGAGNSLARPTSRFSRTESIVSLERAACSCAELQVFSCYRAWKEACQATRVISTTSRRKLSSSFFSPERQKKETLGERAPSYATVKNWVAQFKCGDFSTCDAPRPGRPKTVTTPVIIDQIHKLILEDRRISELEQRAKKCIELCGEYVE